MLLEAVLAVGLIALSLSGLYEVYKMRIETRLLEAEATQIRGLLERVSDRASVSLAVHNLAEGAARFYNQDALLREGLLRAEDQSAFSIDGTDLEIAAYVWRGSGNLFHTHVALLAKADARALWKAEKHGGRVRDLAQHVRRSGYFREAFTESKADFETIHQSDGTVFKIEDRIDGSHAQATLWKKLLSDEAVLLMRAEGRRNLGALNRNRKVSASFTMTGETDVSRLTELLTARADWMHPLHTPLTYNLARALKEGWHLDPASASDKVMEVETPACEEHGKSPVALAASKHLYSVFENTPENAGDLAVLKLGRAIDDGIFESAEEEGLSLEEKDTLKESLRFGYDALPASSALGHEERPFVRDYKKTEAYVQRRYGALGAEESYRWSVEGGAQAARPFTGSDDFIMPALQKDALGAWAQLPSGESDAASLAKKDALHAGLHLLWEEEGSAESPTPRKSLPRPAHALPVLVNLHQRILSCDHQGVCSNVGTGLHKIGALDEREYGVGDGRFKVGEAQFLYPDELLHRLSVCASRKGDSP